MSSRGTVVVRGGGDLATGTAWRMHRCGFGVIVLEKSAPTFVRRPVSFGQAVFDRSVTVERVTANLVDNAGDIHAHLESGCVPVLVDPTGDCIPNISPDVVVDAIIAKHNTGTHIEMAPVVIGVGPGFLAGKDVHAVVESNRGHSLGRVLLEGMAQSDTGIPAQVMGYSEDRVIKVQLAGLFQAKGEIGTMVRKGEIVATVDSESVLAPIDGLLRGLLNSGLTVRKGDKLGDIDPRGKAVAWRSISDKSLAIAGGVLEAALMLGS